MANVVFKKGLLADLPSTKTEGTIYITTDERAIYLDVNGSDRIRLGDFQEVANVEALPKTPTPNSTALYYVKDINCLAKWDSSTGRWVQINKDTGAVNVIVEGSGNAVTTATYDEASRTIKLTKGETFVTSAQLTTKESALEGKIEEAKAAADEAQSTADEAKSAAETAQSAADAAQADATTAKAEADKKVASVKAGDASIKVDGTATAPTVAVQLDTTGGNNALKLVEGKGLRVDVPTAAEYTIEKATEAGEFAAVYQLKKDGQPIGADINIPKDMVVKSGRVVTNPDASHTGTFIELTLANDESTKIYINVGDLIEYVTSGSSTGDMVVVDVNSSTHKVTATITDGTITKAKLEATVQTKIDQAHEHANIAELAKITTGKVAEWDAAEENAKSYTDQQINALADEYATKGSVTQALNDAKGYTDSEIQKALTWGTF